MKLSAPTQPVFIVAFILGLSAILMHFGIVPSISGVQPFILLAIGFVLLSLGSLFRGM